MTTSSLNSDIKTGFSIIRLITDDLRSNSVPIGVAAWDCDTQWSNVRFPNKDEKLSGASSEWKFLLRQTQKQISAAIESQLVPYFNENISPWESHFWTRLRDAFQSGIVIDAPRALARLENPDDQLESLFDAIVKPKRSSKHNATRADGRLTQALGKLAEKTKTHFPLAAFGGANEQVRRGVSTDKGSVVFECVNLAGTTATKEADALVSKLQRIQFANRDLKIIIGYSATPNGLNGETHLKKWMEEKVTSNVFDLVSEQTELCNAAQLAFEQIELPLTQQALCLES